MAGGFKYKFMGIEWNIVKSPLDNMVDRSHYFFTSLLLAAFSVIVIWARLFKDSIVCMAPAEFSRGWVEYVNAFCYVTSTFITASGNNEYPSIDDPQIDVRYYQWVPYVLFAQCLLFYAPHFIWSYAQKTGDVDLEGAVDQCKKIRGMRSTEDRDKAVKTLASYLHKIYEYRHVNGVPQSGLGYAASASYLGMKALNLVNLLVQFTILNHFVGKGDFFWGFKVFSNMNGPASSFFPRTTFCQFNRHVMASNQLKIAQCALPLNILHEMLYVIVYFWFLVLLLITLFDTARYLAFFLSAFLRNHQGSGYLKLLENYSPNKYANEELKKMFIRDTLGRDGLLLLDFIDTHAGTMVASEVACQFFNECSMPLDLNQVDDGLGGKKRCLNVSFENDAKGDAEVEID